MQEALSVGFFYPLEKVFAFFAHILLVSGLKTSPLIFAYQPLVE
jgi:hypothetical protein